MTESSSGREFPRLLLIDDDAISREVLSVVLEMQGFAVDSVEGGEDALAHLESVNSAPGRAPAVILMDTQMPGLSGIPLVHALRQHSIARIIAISGSNVTDSILDATDGFLLKPVAPEALIALLASAEHISTGQSVEATQSAESQNIIDPIVLNKLKSLMRPAAVREIYDVVASDLKARLATLKTAMDSANSAEVARIAHTIKGGCGMVGLSSAVQVATRLEIDNIPEDWSAELLHLRCTLGALEGMLNADFPS